MPIDNLNPTHTCLQAPLLHLLNNFLQLGNLSLSNMLIKRIELFQFRLSHPKRSRWQLENQETNASIRLLN